MTLTLRINARNDIHLPTEILKILNIGEDRIVKVQLKENMLVLVPVDLEPRYSHQELDALDKLHEDEKKKGWIRLESEKDLHDLSK